MRPLLLLAAVVLAVPALAGCSYDGEYYGSRDRDEFCYDERAEFAHYRYDGHRHHGHHHRDYRDRGHVRYHDRYDGGHRWRHRDRDWR